MKIPIKSIKFSRRVLNPEGYFYDDPHQFYKGSLDGWALSHWNWTMKIVLSQGYSKGLRVSTDNALFHM